MSSLTKGLLTSDRDDWETPRDFFDALDAEFGFTLDPCSSDANAKCARHWTRADDGLSKDWSGERVFMNPPYGREIGRWVEKAATSGAEIVVGLLPARTDTAWFHDWVYGKAELRFLRGRLKFAQGGVQGQSAPFPSLLAIWRSPAACGADEER